MLELPEAATLAQQCTQVLTGKTIHSAIAGKSPHKFAWFQGDPAGYDALLRGRKIEGAASFGGILEIASGDQRLVFNDGVTLRYCPTPDSVPDKHQLCVAFEDGSALIATVQMYGGLWTLPKGEEISFICRSGAKVKPSPLSKEFNETYFNSLLTDETKKLSAKAFLATEQRIPGLGNGVLQDILWNAHIHPKCKIASLSAEEFAALYRSVKDTLAEMTAAGGRDTERDLFGNPGGYRTKLSKNTVDKPCPVCGTPIQKAPYMGGAVYWCSGCQKEAKKA